MLDKIIFCINVLIYFLNFFVNVFFVYMINIDNKNLNDYNKIIFNWNRNFISNFSLISNENFNKCPKNYFNFYDIFNNSEINIKNIKNLICLEFNKDFNYFDNFNLIENENFILNNSFKNCGKIDDLNNILIYNKNKKCPNEKNLFYNFIEFKITIQKNNSIINNKNNNNNFFNIDNLNYILIYNFSFDNFYKNNNNNNNNNNNILIFGRNYFGIEKNCQNFLLNFPTISLIITNIQIFIPMYLSLSIFLLVFIFLFVITYREIHKFNFFTDIFIISMNLFLSFWLEWYLIIDYILIYKSIKIIKNIINFQCFNKEILEIFFYLLRDFNEYEKNYFYSILFLLISILLSLYKIIIFIYKLLKEYFIYDIQNGENYFNFELNTFLN